MKDSEEDKPKLVLVSNSASNEKEPKKKDRLTAKQLAFIQGITKEKLTATESYRKAYDCENMKDSSVYVESSRLMTHPKISLRLKEYEESITLNSIATQLSVKEYVENGLKEIIEDEETNSNAKVSALSWLGKSVAMFTDKIENSEEDKSIEQLESELRKKLGLSD